MGEGIFRRLRPRAKRKKNKHRKEQRRPDWYHNFAISSIESPVYLPIWSQPFRNSDRRGEAPGRPVSSSGEAVIMDAAGYSGLKEPSKRR
jgi:hypothetical protein